MKGTKMVYFGIVDRDKDSAYGVWFPDVEGCFSAADSDKDILKNAMEALSLHLEDMNAPEPGSLEDIRAKAAEDLVAGAYMLAVPHVSMNQRQVRANISLPKATLDAIDSAASLRNLTRSAFIAEAAMNEIVR